MSSLTSCFDAASCVVAKGHDNLNWFPDEGCESDLAVLYASCRTFTRAPIATNSSCPRRGSLPPNPLSDKRDAAKAHDLPLSELRNLKLSGVDRSLRSHARARFTDSAYPSVD